MYKIAIILLLTVTLTQHAASDTDSVYIINNLDKTVYIRLGIKNRAEHTLRSFDSSEIIENSNIFEFPINSSIKVVHNLELHGSLLLQIWPAVYYRFRGKHNATQYGLRPL